MNKLLQHIINAGDVDHKILPGLPKMQRAGIVMFKPPANEKAVYDNIPNPAVVRAKMQQDAVAKQAIAKRAADQAAQDRHGYIRQAPPPRSMASKAWAIATNPMTAFAYKAQGRDIPDNFELGPKNSLDIAANMVNPFFYVNEAKEFGKGVGNIAYKGVTDPFSLSGMDFLNTAMHGVGAIPFVAEGVQGANLLSKGLRGATKAYKNTAGMPSKIGRIKNAANVGAIELGYLKGDVTGHSYFNIPADEVSKMMAQEMASLPKGAFTFDGNMSKNSAPLFWTQAARSPKGFTAVNPGTSQLLNWSGTMGRRVKNALPENVESIMPGAPRYTQDLQNRIDLLKKMGDPQSLEKAARLEKEGISSFIISDMPNAAISDETIRKSFGQFLNNYKSTLDNPIIEVNRKTGLNFPMTNIIDKNIGRWTNEFYEQPSIYMVKGNPLSRVPQIVGDYAGQRAKAFFGRNRDYENPRIPFILTNAAYNAGMNIAGQNEQRYGGENNMFKVFAEEGLEYKGPSIVDYLATKGYSGKKAFRKDLAEKYGIEGYDYSAAKNTELLNRLRENDDLLEQNYQPTQAAIPVERMMEMERQARAARQAADQSNTQPTRRPANPAPVYNFSPEFQNMRIPEIKVNTSLQPKVIYDSKFSLKPKMVVPLPFGFNKQTASEIPGNITDPVRPVLGLLTSNIYNTEQEVDPINEESRQEAIPGIGKPMGNKFMFNNQDLYSFYKPQGKNLLPYIPANKPAVKTEKYATKSEVEEKPWYEEVIENTSNFFSDAYDSFAESVNNSPLDFRAMNFGTPVSPQGAIDMTRDLTKRGLSLFSPDFAEKYDNWLNRQQAIKNMDQDPKSSIIVPKYDFAPMYVTGDTIPDAGNRQYHLAESMDVDALRFGVRNRGDLTPIDTEAASITAFHPFVNAKTYFADAKDDPADATYLAYSPDGKIQVGQRKDFENKDVQVSRVFSNRVVDFVREPSGSIKKVPAGAKVNKTAFSPAVTVIGDDGKQKEGKLNLVLPEGNKADEAFGVATGGRFIFKTPDGQTRLVSGSLKNIEEEFKRIKGKNPYVTVVSLDNGSYSRGLRTFDQKLTAQDLRSYDNLNRGGGNFAYLLPGQQTSRPLAKFAEFEQEATRRLQALYPGKKVSVEYQDAGLYNQEGGRDIQTQADIQKKGNSQTPVSLHNFNAARDYVLYVDGKPISGDQSNKAGNDIYKNVLWKAADKTGLYHVEDWDVGHIGLAKEGQKTAFDELKAKYPEIFTNPNFIKSLEYINKNKSNPLYQEYFELLNNIQPFTGAPRTTEFMKRSGTTKKQQGGPVDSTLENIFEIIDPTGLSSWDDVYKSYKETGMSPQTELEIFGALPLLGKVGKFGKIMSNASKVGLKARHKIGLDAISKVIQGVPYAGRGTDAIQAIQQAPNVPFFPSAPPAEVGQFGVYAGMQNYKKEKGGPILDPRGQWAHPGKVTRIPGSDITMQGVPYPVLGIGNNGKKQVMYPGKDYTFGGASYVDEYPMMQKGGWSGGGLSRSDLATMAALNKNVNKKKYAHNHDTRITVEDGSLKEGYKDMRNFMQYWLTERAKDPKFTEWANSRLSVLDNLSGKYKTYTNKDIETGKAPYNTQAFYTNEDSSLNFNTDFPTSFTAPVQIHELTHKMDNEDNIFYDQPRWFWDANLYSTPDSFISKQVIPKNKKFQTNRYVGDRDEYDYLSRPTEMNARLNEFRYHYNLDPKKKYTAEDMKKIINDHNNYKGSFKNLRDELFKSSRNNMQSLDDLLKIIGNDPQKLADLHNNVVKNKTSYASDAIPQVKNGGLLSRSVSCSNCGWSWKAADGGSDPMTCHKCGGVVKMQGGGQSSIDSVRHQANKILQYEQLRGGPGGAPLPQYSNPKYMDMLMGKVYPEVKKIMPNASAMEASEAMDFVFNAGFDQSTNKITKDPRAFALQEYYRQYDKSKLDADGKWVGRKNAPYSFDQEYNNTIGKLPENQRRILMNKGRDWYYRNINNPAPGVPNSNYNDTWYGRIWNTNDYLPFDPKNPKFTPKKQMGGVTSGKQPLEKKHGIKVTYKK
jgi:uncharacterized protein (DUF1778 family)